MNQGQQSTRNVASVEIPQHDRQADVQRRRLVVGQIKPAKQREQRSEQAVRGRPLKAHPQGEQQKSRHADDRGQSQTQGLQA